jgi:hypothetical protein
MSRTFYVKIFSATVMDYSLKLWQDDSWIFCKTKSRNSQYMSVVLQNNHINININGKTKN